MKRSLVAVMVSAFALTSCFADDGTIRVNSQSAENICDVFENGERSEVVPTPAFVDAPDVSKAGIHYEVKLGETQNESVYLSFQKEEEDTLLAFAVNKRIDLTPEHEFDVTLSDVTELGPREYDCDVAFATISTVGAGQVWLGTFPGTDDEYVREDYSLVVMELPRDDINNWETLFCRDEANDSDPACEAYRED